MCREYWVVNDGEVVITYSISVQEILSKDTNRFYPMAVWGSYRKAPPQSASTENPVRPP